MWTGSFNKIRARIFHFKRVRCIYVRAIRKLLFFPVVSIISFPIHFPAPLASQHPVASVTSFLLYRPTLFVPFLFYLHAPFVDPFATSFFHPLCLSLSHLRPVPGFFFLFFACHALCYLIGRPLFFAPFSCLHSATYFFTDPCPLLTPQPLILSAPSETLQPVDPFFGRSVDSHRSPTPSDNNVSALPEIKSATRRSLCFSHDPPPFLFRS